MATKTITPLTKFPTVPKSITKKVADGKPLTVREKLTVLERTRTLMASNHTTGSWSESIDGIEYFCLYGGIGQVCGIGASSANDTTISQCSLTSTMFDAISDSNPIKKLAKKEIKQVQERFKKNRASAIPEQSHWYTEAREAAEILDTKVAFLQTLNDDKGRAAVLRVLDKAILNLKQQIAS